jgi:hypothetical protein
MAARLESNSAASGRTPAGAVSCALDEQGLRRQRERYARLAPSVVHVQRPAQKLIVEFASGFDRATLDALIAVERECCPFFAFEFDEGSRRLRVGVREPDAAAALEALADAFSPSARAGFPHEHAHSER